MESEVNAALEKLGRFSRWQLLIYSLISISLNVSGTWHMLSVVFIGGEPDDYFCHVDEADEGNYTPSGKCHVQFVNGTENATKMCPSGWDYDDSIGPTIITEWDLVCDRNYLMESSQTVFNGGIMFGALVFTSLSDMYGRKSIHLMCQWLLVVVGFATAFSPNFTFFAVFRFLGGALREGLGLSGITMACELFPAEQRTFAGIALQFFWCLAWFLLSLLAFLIRDWRKLQIALSLPCILTVSYIWLVPESIPWLVANGREKEAEEILQKAAKFNKMKNPGTFLPQAESSQGETKNARSTLCPCLERKEKLGSQYTIKDICRSRILLLFTFAMCSLWFVNVVVYYGLSLSTSLLAGDRYLNFFLSGLVEVPAYAVTLISVQKFGRKLPLFIFHVIAGLSLLSLAFLPKKLGTHINLSAAETGLTMVGKYGITASFAVIVLYAGEIFPTTLRNEGLGLASIAGRIGGIAAPFAVYLAKITPWIPNVIFGVMAILGAGLGLLLPETANRPLPQTIEDIENWKRLGKQRTAKGTDQQPAHLMVDISKE